MKRFYKIVTIAKKPEGYGVLLDGKPIKTPLKNKLVAPTEGLAEAIMREWAAQVETIKPETMGLTQILTTAIDHVQHERADYETAIMRYVDTDLLCYQTKEPPAISERQKIEWGRWLNAIESLVGQKPEVTYDLQALNQSEAYKKALQDLAREAPIMDLTVLQLVISLTGSVILGVLFYKGHMNAQQIYDAIMLEDNYKAKIYDEEKYGAAPFQEKARMLLRGDLDAAEKFLSMVRE